MEDLKHTRRLLKSTHTQKHKHINAHYGECKITTTNTIYIFRLSANEDEVMQLKNERLNAAVSEGITKGICCTVYCCECTMQKKRNQNVYLKLNEGIMKQRITDTIALILDRSIEAMLPVIAFVACEL